LFQIHTCGILFKRGRNARKNPVQCGADAADGRYNYNRNAASDQGIFDSGGRRLVRKESLELSNHGGSVSDTTKASVKSSPLNRALFSSN
jgi:hypothetical protein